MPAIPPPHCNAQRGSTLIIALLLIVLLSIIGIQGYRRTASEERLAGNTEDLHRAFEGASATVALAGAYIDNQAAITDDFTTYAIDSSTSWAASQAAAPPEPPTVRTGTNFLTTGNGYHTMAAMTTALGYTSCVASTASGCTASHLAGLPEADIDYLGEEIDLGASLVPDEAVTPKQLYRITARSAGGSATARVVLEAMYQR